MKQLNVRFLLTNCPWVSYIFLQKSSSFKRFSILEENCGADIINVTFKCDLFVDRCLKTCRWVSYTFLQKPSLFNHFWIRASFSRNFFVCKINDFGKINIWRFWWRRNVMKTKIDCQKLKRKVNVSLENHLTKMLMKKKGLKLIFFNFFSSLSIVYERKDFPTHREYTVTNPTISSDILQNPLALCPFYAAIWRYEK